VDESLTGLRSNASVFPACEFGSIPGVAWAVSVAFAFTAWIAGAYCAAVCCRRLQRGPVLIEPRRRLTLLQLDLSDLRPVRQISDPATLRNGLTVRLGGRERGRIIQQGLDSSTRTLAALALLRGRLGLLLRPSLLRSVQVLLLGLPLEGPIN
jgi:hypothetical protein